MKCSRCGSEIKDKNAFYCPSCGVSLGDAPPTSSKKVSFLTVGGVLAIVASCLGVILGMVGLINSLGPPTWWTEPLLRSKELFVGELGTLAFVPCLVGGVLALKRKEYIASMIGICFLLISGTIAILLSPDLILLILGASITVLTLLAAITVTAARGKFSYRV